MPRFEVFCPAAPPEVPIDITLRVDAEHWLAALKVGMQRAGITQAAATNVLCDVQADGSIHVTDPRGGGVFRIQELHAEAAPSTAPRPAATPMPVFRSVAAPAAPAEAPGARLQAPGEKPTAPPAEAPGSRLQAPGEKSTAPPTAAPTATPAPPAPAAKPLASAKADRVEQVAGPASPPTGRIGRVKSPPTHEDVLAELFERVGEVSGAERAKALDALLDLALEKAGAEAGTIFLAGLGSDDLEFAVTRGPRAKELLELGIRVPMGVGIVGFCAREDVCLAISDAQQDPRFYRAISEAIGYETRSILCAPIARDGRVYGALEVLNKRGGQAFGPDDLAIVAYLAHHAAGHLAG
jgi:hypothetical protein